MKTIRMLVFNYDGSVLPEWVGNKMINTLFIAKDGKYYPENFKFLTSVFDRDNNMECIYSKESSAYGDALETHYGFVKLLRDEL